MKYRKSMIVILLAIFLFSITSVCANEMDTTVQDENASQMLLSVNNNVIEDTQLKQSNDETVSSEYQLEVLNEGEGTYTDLKNEIGDGGNKKLTKTYYYYNNTTDVNTTNIEISNPGVIDGNGAVIDLKGSTIQGFFVKTPGVTIKNLTIKNANYNGDGGAIYFCDPGEVINCNFVNNSAEYGSAVYFSEEGTVTNSNFTNNHANHYGAIVMNSGTVTNCNFVNNSASSGDGGAVHFDAGGTVKNCNFNDNNAFYYGGAVYFGDPSEVINCNFVNNSVSSCDGGAVFFSDDCNLTNCTFVNNTARRGGAVFFLYDVNVTNCNFNDNNAFEYGGAIYFYGSGTVTNCNFTGNKAVSGSAIYFFKYENTNTLTISNSSFLNNRANVDELQVTINENNITIIFTGQNNLLNAINSYGDVSFTNVTYWGANGIANTDSSTPSRSNKEAGQNITVAVFVNAEVVLNEVKVTDENGMIVLPIKTGENYFIGVLHNADSYYTESRKTISNNASFSVNVTSQTTHNRTVNITAKSNILNEVMDGKLLFIFPTGVNVTANYAGNGTWWVLHTFDEYGDYQVNATYEGLDNVTINNATISISKTPTNISIENTTFTLFVLDSIGTGASLTPADAGNLTFTSNNISVAKVEDGKIIAVSEGTAIITVSFAENADYTAAENKTITVNVFKYDSKVTIEPINDTVYPNNVTIRYSIENKTNITVTIDGVTSDKIIITNDTITVIGLDSGNYTIAIINNESNLYYKSNDTKSFTVNKLATCVDAANVSTTYNINKDLVITLKDSNGKALAGVKVTVDLNGAKTYTTDSDGQVKVTTKGLAPKTYTAKITFNGNTNYVESSKNVKVTVKKAKPKITAKKKTFKKTKKVKKFKIVLKNNVGKPIKKAKLTLKIKGKKYKAKTNSKGKATFKIKKLNKKGTFKAKIKYKGNKYYKKLTKKVKIKVSQI